MRGGGESENISKSPEVMLLEQLLGENLASDGTVSKEDFLKALPAVYQASYIFNDEEGNYADADAPVSSAAILRALPKSWTVEEVADFRAELRTKVDEDGNLERQEAVDFLVAEVIRNPGDAIHRGENGLDLVSDGYISPALSVTGNMDVSLDNEVNIYSSDRGILIASADMATELSLIHI